MAIIKLVCQGCGANLDALDSSPIVQCGYCGSQNHIKPAQPEAPSAPAPPQPQVIHYQVAPSLVRAHKSTGKGIAVFLAFGAIIPIVVGAGLAFWAVKGGDIMVQRSTGGGRPLAGDGPTRQFLWESGRPFAADLDADGSEDVIGIVQMFGSSNMSIVAISGADWKVLWEREIGDRSTMPDAPLLRFVDSPPTAVFAMGSAVRGIDAATGSEKWVANLPDKAAALVLDGDHLWARSIDESIHTIALADGRVVTATGDPGPNAKVLRTDEGYDLIPSNRQLDLGYEAFADVRIETAFCPPEHLALTTGPSHGFDPVPCTLKHGLAWVSRSKGTAVPFLVAYDPTSKQERWRQQLTAAGSLETIDSGFNQPRAEFVEGDAVVSFSPSKADGAATIRRFAMADGATQWDVVLARTSTENVDGMMIGKDRMYVVHGGALVVLELATGKQIERLGGW